jgi:acetyl-CoA acetyltransferase
MENMDLAPYLVSRARWGYRMGDGQLYDSVLRDGLNDAFSDAHSGWHTEDLVEKYQVTRDAQDRWALRSQQRFASAQTVGHFNAQIDVRSHQSVICSTQFGRELYFSMPLGTGGLGDRSSWGHYRQIHETVLSAVPITADRSRR